MVLQGGAKASTGDVVFVASDSKWDYAHLKECVEVGARGAFCLVQFYKLKSYSAEKCFATWQADGDSLTLIPVHCVLAPATFSASQDGVVTLVPFHLK